MDFFELAAQRHSVRKYERGVSIPDAELKRIFDVTTLSPSSFNCQHWKFVVVRDQERKTRLRGLSFDQAQVEECSAVVVVCGRLDGHADAGRIYADADPEAREKFVPMIEAVYRDQSQLQREEALRSGALAAMSLMYAAKNAGWDTGPMIGFDAGKVAAYLELDAQTIPVMMVTLGKALDGAQPPRGYRRPVNEVVKLESMNGAGLA
jgi:putative NAD(P)H nitroreductase